MKYKRFFHAGWVVVLAGLLLALVVTPASAAHKAKAAPPVDSTPIDATIYITTNTLQSLFQSEIDRQVPALANNAILSIIGKLPKQDQAWAQQMANALLQPSASLVSLTPEKDGLATSLTLSLYAGDPKPTNASMLVSFSVADSSTIQVSAQPLNGSPTLISGPLTTFQIPIGQLNSIATTPGCGDAALAVNLKFPVSLGHTALHSTSPALADPLQPRHSAARPDMSSVPAYVEIPASSLSALSNSIGSISINSNLTSRNIKISVVGSDLVIDSDVYLGSSFKLGTAHTTLQPTASNGNLAVHVLSTTLTIFSIFTFPYNSYNAQIEQTLNSRLNGALAGKFYVNQAAIGSNSHVPCTASDSLVLSGTTNLG